MNATSQVLAIALAIVVVIGLFLMVMIIRSKEHIDTFDARGVARLLSSDGEVITTYLVAKMPRLTYDSISEEDILTLQPLEGSPISIRLGDKTVLEYCSDNQDPRCNAKYLYNIELYENQSGGKFSRQIFSDGFPLSSLNADEEILDELDYVIPYVWTPTRHRFSFFTGSDITITAQEVNSIESPLPQLH